MRRRSDVVLLAVVIFTARPARGEEEDKDRLGDRLSAGATLELGRSFTFADPGGDLSTIPDPAFGYRALAAISWRTGKVEPLEETPDE